MDISFRDGNEEDVNFIMSSYLKSCRSVADNPRMTNKVYYFNYGKLIKSIISKCNCVVACDVEDDKHIYGYVIYEEVDDILVIHYMYVKYTFRMLGIGKMLFDAIVAAKDTIVITHTNKLYDTINKKKKLNWHYNPFLRTHETKGN